jgi:hypothetical protein
MTALARRSFGRQRMTLDGPPHIEVHNHMTKDEEAEEAPPWFQEYVAATDARIRALHDAIEASSGKRRQSEQTEADDEKPSTRRENEHGLDRARDDGRIHSLADINARNRQGKTTDRNPIIRTLRDLNSRLTEKFRRRA